MRVGRAAIQRKESICCMEIKCNIHFSSFGQQRGLRETSDFEGLID